jgi:hypothetical protein
MIGIPKYRNIIVDGLSRISTNGNANIGVDSINKVNNKNSFIMMIGGLASSRQSGFYEYVALYYRSCLFFMKPSSDSSFVNTKTRKKVQAV